MRASRAANFSKTSGALVIARFRSSDALSQSAPAAVAGQPQRQPHAERVAAHRPRRLGDHLQRQDRARPGHRHRARADRRRRARRGAQAHQAGARRHRATPNEGQTAGSQSVQDSGTAVRFACAEAREMLLAAAAAKLGDAAKLKVRRRHHQQFQLLPTGRWRGEIDLKKEASGTAKPKPAAEHKWIGKSIPRHDIPRKFTGGAAYVQDIRLPGMVFGRVVRPPSPGAQLVSVDEASMKEHARAWSRWCATAVSSPSPPSARSRRSRRAPRSPRAPLWKESATLPPWARRCTSTWSGAWTCRRRSCVDKTGRRGGARRRRSRRATRARSRRTARSARRARWRSGQERQAARLDAQPGRLSAARRPRQRVRPRAGGGALHARRRRGLLRPQRRRRRGARRGAARARDRRPAGQAAVDARRRVHVGAVRLGDGDEARRRARRAGQRRQLVARAVEPSAQHAPGPVQGRAYAGGAASREAGRRGAGRATCRCRRAAPTATRFPRYDFPNVKVSKHFIVESPLRTSALRTLGGYANVFALESFMDELAAAAGADPVEFRLRHMKDPRARAVIEATAARGPVWKPRRGQRLGFRLREVQEPRLLLRGRRGGARSIAQTGQVRVQRAVSAVDVGQVGEPRRRRQPDRGRHHPVGELDAEGGGELRPHAREDALVGRLPDPALRRGAAGRRGDPQPAGPAVPRRRRRLARAGGGRDRQRDRERDRQAPARPSVYAGARKAALA